jgi:hypothetical protein
VEKCKKEKVAQKKKQQRRERTKEKVTRNKKQDEYSANLCALSPIYVISDIGLSLISKRPISD